MKAGMHVKLTWMDGRKPPENKEMTGVLCLDFQVGYPIMISLGGDRYWLTTTVVKVCNVLLSKDGDQITFRTQNSKYNLTELKQLTAA